jgi:hypothetical protein
MLRASCKWLASARAEISSCAVLLTAIGVTKNQTTESARWCEFGPRFGEIDHKTTGGTDNHNALNHD